jgi:DNA-binding transcriptional LysR family regulator
MKTGDLRQYHYFLILAQELHFGRAAEKCFVTQSALSQQISRLEDTLGVKLFVREPRQVVLTPPGEVLRDGVAQLFTDIDQLTRRTRAAAGIDDLQLSIGQIEYATTPILPPSLVRLQALHPTLTVLRHEMHGSATIAAVQRGQIDIGLGVALALPDASAIPGIERAALASSQWRLLMRADHPLAQVAHLTPAALAQERLIWFARDINPPVYDSLLQMWRAAGVVPNIVYHTSQVHSGIKLAAEGVGLMLGSGFLLDAPGPGMVTVPLQGVAPLTIEAYCRSDETRPLVRDFLAILRDESIRSGAFADAIS